MATKNQAIDYTKVIAEVAEQYRAFVTCECGVYQIDYGVPGLGGEISDKLREVLSGAKFDLKLYQDGMIELEILE
jgi:hypothetical protein